mgnify:CR=1 FL=1
MSKQNEKPAPASELERLEAGRAELVARLAIQERDVADMTKPVGELVTARTTLLAITGTIADIDRAIAAEQARLDAKKLVDLERQKNALIEAFEKEHGGFDARLDKAKGYLRNEPAAKTEADVIERAEFMKALMIERMVINAKRQVIEDVRGALWAETQQQKRRAELKAEQEQAERAQASGFQRVYASLS